MALSKAVNPSSPEGTLTELAELTELTERTELTECRLSSKCVENYSMVLARGVRENTMSLITRVDPISSVLIGLLLASAAGGYTYGYFIDCTTG